jgi:hypothetical protein
MALPAGVVMSMPGKIDPEAVQLGKETDQVLQGSPEPIDRPRHDDIELAPILRRMRQRPFVLEHLSKIAAIDPPTAGRTEGEMLGLVRGRLPEADAHISSVPPYPRGAHSTDALENLVLLADHPRFPVDFPVSREFGCGDRFVPPRRTSSPLLPGHFKDRHTPPQPFGECWIPVLLPPAAFSV